MNMNNYQYGTNPKKIKHEERPNKKRNAEIQNQIKINEKQKAEALKMEKKKHNKNVALVIAIFLLLLVISYRSSLINEKFSELQSKKAELASIEKTNGQLEVSIESSLNLSKIEQEAKEKLGMQKLDNSQKVYVTLDKKDYVESSVDNIDITQEKEDCVWYKKIIQKIFNK